ASGGAAADLKVVGFGSTVDKAMGTGIPTRVVNLGSIADEVAYRGYPNFVDTTGVRSVAKGAEFDGHTAAATGIREDRVIIGSGEEATGNSDSPVGNDIRAEQSFATWIRNLEIVITVRQTGCGWRSVWTRPTIEIDASSAALGGVRILIHACASDIGCKDSAWKRRRRSHMRRGNDRD